MAYIGLKEVIKMGKLEIEETCPFCSYSWKMLIILDKPTIVKCPKCKKTWEETLKRPKKR